MSADTAVVKGSVKPAKSKSRRVPIWRRSPSLVVGAVIVLFTCIVAAFPSLFTSQDPLAINPSQMLQAPSAAHLFGTRSSAPSPDRTHPAPERVFFYLPSSYHLIFNVDKPIRTRIMVIIQKRTTTCVSFHPFCSK